MESYVVELGDTLYSIGNKYGVSIDEIISANNLKDRNLYVGQVLNIPIPTDTVSPATTYTVKRGDTLYGISNQFGVCFMDIMDINNLNGTVLQIGQVLEIPTKQGDNPVSFFTYTVKQGDSLYNIAKRFDTTVDMIIRVNNLSSISLDLGQKLLIPETVESYGSLPSYVNYTVKPGDSLYSIAEKYNLNVDVIMKDNNLNSDNLSVGQNLKIRTSGIDTEIEECYGEDYTSIPTTYTVKAGDNIWKIAQQYNISVADLKSKNNLTSNVLSVGQKLKI